MTATFLAYEYPRNRIKHGSHLLTKEILWYLAETNNVATDKGLSIRIAQMIVQVHISTNKWQMSVKLKSNESGLHIFGV